MVIIFVRIEARPDKRKELSQTLHSIVEEIRKEVGCLHSGFYQDLERENGFLMFEEWATQKDSDDHLRSDLFTVLMGAGTLMSQSPEIVIHTVDRSKKLETGTPKPSVSRIP